MTLLPRDKILCGDKIKCYTKSSGSIVIHVNTTCNNQAKRPAPALLAIIVNMDESLRVLATFFYW